MGMRLYRGLKESYRSERVKGPAGRTIFGTDFTDCPHTALLYAQGRRGVVLVLEKVPDAKVTEELWLGAAARRLMVWGRFDKFVVAALPAKELRNRIRRKGVAATSAQNKSDVLKRAIEEMLKDKKAG